MSALYRDPKWPRASAWLAGECLPGAHGLLSVIGAPVTRGSITPGRSDLAPAAIRSALERYSTAELSGGGRDLRMLRARDQGDLPLAQSSIGDAFLPIRDSVAAEVAKASAVVILGGDNGITWPGVHALGAPLARCGLLTFDAHFDLRDLDRGLTNGNPVRALLADGLPGHHIVQIGIQSFANSSAYASVARESGIEVVTVEDVMEHGIAKVVEVALDSLGADVDHIYVDLDLDVLDRAYAPATPGSRPGGLMPWAIRRAARLCGAHPLVRAMDLVEIDPTRDVADLTSLAAAACLLEFAAGVLTRYEAE